MGYYLDPLDIRSVRSHLGQLGTIGADGWAVHPVGFGAQTQARGVDRYALFEAWEKKYRRYPSRVEQSWLTIARPADIVARMRTLGVRDPAFAGSSFGADDAGMRAVYTEAFRRVWGRSPTPPELEAEMAVGRHETLYGAAKFPGGLGPGMHNHGAVQCCKPSADGSCPDNAFLSQDTHPTASGNVPYAICFKRYPDDVSGAADVIKHVGKDPLALMAKWGNSLAAFAAGMYLNGYFESHDAPAKVLADPKNMAAYKGILKLADTLPPGKGHDKLADSTRAGRVLMYAIGLDKCADSAVKAYGGKRQTQFLPVQVGRAAKGGAIIMGGIVAVGLAGYALTREKTRAA